MNMKKKIKDLTLKEFYLFVAKQMEELRPYCLGEEPIEMLTDKTISKYLKDNGEKEVKIDESDNEIN